MKELIEAFQIFLKYSEESYPTNCDHDIMRVNVDPDLVSTKDITKLDELGFNVDNDLDCFYSFKYGSN